DHDRAEVEQVETSAQGCLGVVQSITTNPMPHWIGQVTARNRPTRLVQGGEAVSAATAGGTMTQRLQTTVITTSDAAARVSPSAFANTGPPGGVLTPAAVASASEGVAERTTAVRSQGRPSTPQSASPTLG